MVPTKYPTAAPSRAPTAFPTPTSSPVASSCPHEANLNYCANRVTRKSCQTRNARKSGCAWCGNRCAAVLKDARNRLLHKAAEASAHVHALCSRATLCTVLKTMCVSRGHAGVRERVILLVLSYRAAKRSAVHGAAERSAVHDDAVKRRSHHFQADRTDVVRAHPDPDRVPVFCPDAISNAFRCSDTEPRRDDVPAAGGHGVLCSKFPERLQVAQGETERLQVVREPMRGVTTELASSGRGKCVHALPMHRFARH